MSDEKLLRREEAAAYVRETYNVPCSPSYLAKLAVIGGGPKFQRVSRYPLYTPPNLDAWVRSRMTATASSTSELAAA